MLNISQYIGIPFSQMQCLEFAVHVLKHGFGCDITIPETVLAQDQQTRTKLLDATQFGNQVNDPLQWRDGDVIVLSQTHSPVLHIGVLIAHTITKQWLLLHSRNAAIGSTCEPLNRALSQGLNIVGVYRHFDLE